jgi:Fur family ferric uptake transcriptional regulator
MRRRRLEAAAPPFPATPVARDAVEVAIAALASEEQAAVVRRGLERLRAFIAERGLHVSVVREVVAVGALTMPGHFEALDVVSRIRAAKVANAYEASVYRTLPLLVEAGLIRSVVLSSRTRQIFEPAFEREPHDHLVCQRCDRVVEVVSEQAAHDRRVAALHGFSLTGSFHELIGVCDSCLRAEAAEHG